MRIGILGGAFNPPHLGHLILGQEALEAFKLDKVFLIPTNLSPHKQNNNIEAMHRLNMVNLSVLGNDKFEVLDIEIKRGGISYTIDTVNQLKEIYPRCEFYLIVGSDLSGALSAWQKFDELKKAVKIIIAQRENYPLVTENSYLKLKITQIGISSSRIRQAIKEGCSVRYFLSDGVGDYIRKHRVYPDLNNNI